MKRIELFLLKKSGVRSKKYRVQKKAIKRELTKLVEKAWKKEKEGEHNVRQEGQEI